METTDSKLPGDDNLEEVQLVELSAAEKVLSLGSDSPKGSWELASQTVTNYRPVAGFLWRMVHPVLGKGDKIGKPDPIIFDAMRQLIFQAAMDKRLGVEGKQAKSIDEAVTTLGFDTAAAICVLHGICRRISSTMMERLWRPIIDDALLRAYIGYLIGKQCPAFGAGRGMLAGFSGRAGLAIQIASGDRPKAQRVMEELAAGMDLKDVGMKIYGCDPLQVSAMTLASAGVSSEASYGVAAFSKKGKGLPTGGQAFLWLSAFTIAEYLRICDADKVDEKYWRALGLNNDESRKAIEVDALKLLRIGHGWPWLVELRMGS